MCLYERGTRLFQHLKNFLKPVVVEYGHERPLPGCNWLSINYFLSLFFAAGQQLYVAQVLCVHHKNAVESGKVFLLKLPCALGECQCRGCAPPGYGTRVGQFAGMPVPGACTLANLPVEPSLSSFLFHDSLCQGAAADIAQANHQDAHKRMF